MSLKRSSYKRVGFIILIIMLGIFLPSVSCAQATVEVGVHGGVSYYNGDINPTKPYVMPQATYGALVRYNLNDRWSVNLAYSHAKVAGDGLVSVVGVPKQIFNFVTTIDDISLTGEFNFMNYLTGSKKNRLSPYLMGGAGFFFYTPRDNSGADLRSQGQSLAAVFGLGFKYSLTKRLGFGAEWSMHKTFTDYLDGVADASSNPIQGVPIGNGNGNDWFNITSLSLTYKINLIKNTGCNGLKW